MSFYYLGDPRDPEVGSAVTDFLDSEPVVLGAAPRCAGCNRAIGSLPWLPPHRAELEVWGAEYGDIAFGGTLLFSERCAEAFRQERLSGLSGFREVEVVKVTRRGGSRLTAPPPRYLVVDVARSRAAIDVAASGLDLDPPSTCDECRLGGVKRIARLVLEDNTWSGEDVFIARGLPGTVLTSQRFKEFFDRHAINNGVLIEASEYSFDFYPWEKNQGSSES